jgi:hypothetical protein
MLDGSSRKIIATGEFEAETTENAIKVLKKAQRECLKWYSIKAVFTVELKEEQTKKTA